MVRSGSRTLCPIVLREGGEAVQDVVVGVFGQVCTFTHYEFLCTPDATYSTLCITEDGAEVQEKSSWTMRICIDYLLAHM